jgi:hypothetical protein
MDKFYHCLKKVENSPLMKKRIGSYAGAPADMLCRRFSVFSNDETVAETVAIVSLADSFSGKKPLPEIMAECRRNAESQSQKNLIDTIVHTCGDHQTYALTAHAARQYTDAFCDLDPFDLYRYFENWQKRKRRYIREYYRHIEGKQEEESIDKFYEKILKRVSERKEELHTLKALNLNSRADSLPAEAYAELCSVMYPTGYRYCTENIVLMTAVTILKKGSHNRKISDVLRNIIASGQKEKIEYLMKIAAKDQARRYLASMISSPEEVDPKDLLKVMTYWNSRTKKQLLNEVYRKYTKEEEKND